jgi:hypothetical protein
MSAAEQLDLTIGVLGQQLPLKSQCIRWRDGHRSVLPAVYDDSDLNHNLCDTLDIPLINFISSLQSSNANSEHVVHFRNEMLTAPREADVTCIAEVVGHALSKNMCVLFHGVAHKPPANGLTGDYLDVTFGISPDQPVSIHGAC